MGRVIAVIAVLFAVAGPASAQTPRSPAQERQAAENRANTILVGRALCAAAGGFLLWLAVAVARGGLGVGPGPRSRGPHAWAVAAVLAGAGLAVAVVGVVRMPDWIRPF